MMTDYAATEILGSPLPGPQSAGECSDLARMSNLAALRLQISRHPLDREAAPVAYTLAGHYHALLSASCWGCEARA